MNRLSKTLLSAAALPLALFAVGCDDPLIEAQIISSTRVLGARVEVSGDAERAAPAPGDSASVSWLVAAPEPKPLVGWTFLACLSQPVDSGAGHCDAPAFAMATSATVSSDQPVFDFQVPGDVDRSQLSYLNILGTICPDALPTGDDPANATCDSGAQATRVALALALADGTNANQNPEFAADAVHFDDATWPSASADASPCDDANTPHVHAGSEHNVALFGADDASEPVPKQIDSDPGRESLLFSHFSSTGELNRPFTSVTYGATPQTQLSWKAPGSASASGDPSYFWFVLRDLRGGASFQTRQLCVVP